MKKVILIVTAFLLCGKIVAQDVYLIATSQNNTTLGLDKSTLPKSKYDNYAPTAFYLTSENQNLGEVFLHVNRNLAEISKIRQTNSTDQMEIKTMTKAQVSDANPVDLDVMVQTHTKQQILDFCYSLRGKKVYIIDRSSKTGFFGLFKYKAYQVEHIYPAEF